MMISDLCDMADAGLVKELFVVGVQNITYNRQWTVVVGDLKHTTVDPLEFKDKFRFEGYEGDQAVFGYDCQERRITIKLMAMADEGTSAKESVARILSGRRYYENHKQVQPAQGAV